MIEHYDASGEQDVRVRYPKWLKGGVIGGLATSAALFIAAGYAGSRAIDSENKALQLASKAGRNPDEFYDAFRSQNDHTIHLGEAEHYLRLASGAIALVTFAGASGVVIGAEHQLSATEKPH